MIGSFSVLLKKMNESVLEIAIECQVCAEALDMSTKVLPCGHSYHKKCIQDWVGRNPEFVCPGCRTLFHVEVDRLPPNVVLNHILESRRNAKKKSPAKCSLSKNGKETGEVAFEKTIAKIPVEAPNNNTENTDDHVEWSCNYCTFLNNPVDEECAVCSQKNSSAEVTRITIKNNSLFLK